MFEIFTVVGVGAVAFVAGAIVGAANTATVSSAVNIIKAAEQEAQATLTQITAHKAS